MRLAAVIFTVLAIPLSFGSGASAQETFYSPGTLSHRDRVAAQAALVGQIAENHRRNRYPDTVAWQQVIVRQAAEPLSMRTTAEARIEAALRQPTKLEFVGTSLAAVIDYLKDLHGIEIQIDHWALAQAGLGPDTPVTQNLKNVSLRSALRLMLGQMGLTYVVRDEVLLITTRERADTMPQTRIYRDPRPTTVYIQSTALTPW